MELMKNYFNAEKHESVLFILVGIVAIVLSLYFLFFQKDIFYKGLAWPLIVIAIIQITVGSIVLVRSPKDIIRMENIISTKPQKIQTEEIPRMEAVIKNFIIYRYVEIFLIVLGLILMFLISANSFWSGIGIGLFIQSTLMLSLDFFAERRAHEYINYLIHFN